MLRLCDVRSRKAEHSKYSAAATTRLGLDCVEVLARGQRNKYLIRAQKREGEGWVVKGNLYVSLRGDLNAV